MTEHQRFSLDQQIDEVEHELRMRRDVYPRLVRKGQMRQSIADMHLARMANVGNTLRWLRDNEAAIRDDVRKSREKVDATP